LAEDDEDIAFLFRRMFRSFEPEWQMEWSRDGIAAIDYFMKSGPPDVLVTDLNMPGMNGYEIMAWLRTQPKSACPPIVVYSSTDDETTRERCREAGASEFISKATQLPRLHELLRRILLTSHEGPWRDDAANGGATGGSPRA
jgi:CheY-like chemotaxis protein